MSAKIPNTMLLSDLLKATGYDCPDELVGKTVAEIVAGNTDETVSETMAENTGETVGAGD